MHDDVKVTISIPRHKIREEAKKMYPNYFDAEDMIGEFVVALWLRSPYTRESFVESMANLVEKATLKEMAEQLSPKQGTSRPRLFIHEHQVVWEKRKELGYPPPTEAVTEWYTDRGKRGTACSDYVTYECKACTYTEHERHGPSPYCPECLYGSEEWPLEPGH